MTARKLEAIVLAPLPDHLRVKMDEYDTGFTSPWLRHEADGVLTFRFGKSDFVVNLNIPLSDGSFLTSHKNKAFYTLVTRWIHEQHYPRSRKLARMKNHTAKKKLWTVLRSLDKLILNSDTLLLHQHGFGLVTPGTINAFADDFIRSNNAHEAIYDWPKTLSRFLLEKIAEPRTYDFQKFVEQNPIFLEPIAERTQRNLEMEDEEIFQARVWLYHNGFYKKAECEAWPGHVRTSKLVEILYPYCTMAAHMRPLSHELEIQMVQGHLREYPQVPVREEKIGATALRFNDFCRSLKSQKLLPKSLLKIPDLTLEQLQNKDERFKLASLGTYVTLPHYMTINSLQRSILFFEEKADLILNFIASVVSKAAVLNVDPGSYYETCFAANGISENPFKSWNLYARSNLAVLKGNSADTFRRIRGLECALQAYYILLGSVQYAVGFFTARRQAELLNMKFRDVFPEQSYISTTVMKTGLGEQRLTFDLPTIPIVLRMLSRLERFLKDCGLSQEDVQSSQCFGRISMGRHPKVIPSDSKRYNMHLDVLCDYLETDVVEGHRYYVRQHQLRRAFAIGFFYLNTRGNLSVLSYYFGHMDFKQIYRYLTTVVGNKEMLDIKAAYLAEETLEGGQASLDLLSKLGAFAPGTILKVQERKRLEIYYRSLLESQDIDVQPTFLQVNGCDQVLISITLRKSPDGER